jgi:hypothetical protein
MSDFQLLNAIDNTTQELEKIRLLSSQEGSSLILSRMGYKCEIQIDYLKAAIRARRGQERDAILEEMRQEIEAI